MVHYWVLVGKLISTFLLLLPLSANMRTGSVKMMPESNFVSEVFGNFG